MKKKRQVWNIQTSKARCHNKSRHVAGGPEPTRTPQTHACKVRGLVIKTVERGTETWEVEVNGNVAGEKKTYREKKRGRYRGLGGVQVVAGIRW